MTLVRRVLAFVVAVCCLAWFAGGSGGVPGPVMAQGAPTATPTPVAIYEMRPADPAGTVRIPHCSGSGHWDTLDPQRGPFLVRVRGDSTWYGPYPVFVTGWYTIAGSQTTMDLYAPRPGGTATNYVAHLAGEGYSGSCPAGISGSTNIVTSVTTAGDMNVATRIFVAVATATPQSLQVTTTVSLAEGVPTSQHAEQGIWLAFIQAGGVLGLFAASVLGMVYR